MADKENIDTLKQSIRDKMADDNLAPEELAILRKEIGCLSAEAKRELKKFFNEEITQIQQDTRAKLDSLLAEI